MPIPEKAYLSLLSLLNSQIKYGGDVHFIEQLAESLPAFSRFCHMYRNRLNDTTLKEEAELIQFLNDEACKGNHRALKALDKWHTY